jgi:transcriptional regulator with XRE-family HTH domain
MSRAETEALGARIKSLRQAASLTQEQVADRSGLHVTYVASVESGKRNPSFLSLKSLSKGIGIPMSELLDGLG